MAGWLSNPWIVGIVTSVVGGLLVTGGLFGGTVAGWLSNPWIMGLAISIVVVGSLVIGIRTKFLKLRQRRRESGAEVNRLQSSGKSKVYLTAAVIGLVAAWPVYHLAIWLWDGTFREAVLEQLEAGAVLRD